MARPLPIRSGIAALFIEGALWSTIRLLSFTYEHAQGADLGPQHQTPGRFRLQFVGISVGAAGVLFLVGAGLRKGGEVARPSRAGPGGRRQRGTARARDRGDPPVPPASRRWSRQPSS